MGNESTLGISKPYGVLECSPMVIVEMRVPTLPTVIVFVSHDNLPNEPLFSLIWAAYMLFTVYSVLYSDLSV